MLVALRPTERFNTRNERYWLCRCDCGAEREVNSGRFPEIVSCGCANYSHRSGVELGSPEALWRSRIKKLRQTAKGRGLSFTLSVTKAREVMLGNCHYCDRPPRIPLISGSTILRNTIDRVDSALGYEEDNVVPCCLFCNRGKGAQSATDWETWLDETARNRAARPPPPPPLRVPPGTMFRDMLPD